MDLNNQTFIYLSQFEESFATQFFGTSDWVWIIIFILVLILVWWLISRAVDLSKQESHELTINIMEEESEKSEEETDQVMDDLTRIEGIGPKINQVLQGAGIFSYKQLSESDPVTLQSLLDESRLSFTDPDSWPEQAKLAAGGNWDELKELQQKLRGGRRE